MSFRFLNIIAVSFYTASFMWAYVSWINPVWDYIGIGSKSPVDVTFSYAYFFSILPSFWMPLVIKRPTMILYWVLYLMTYIPMIVAVSFSSKFSLTEVYSFHIYFAVGFFLTGASYKFKLLTFKYSYVRKALFWRIFYTITFFLFIYVFYIFIGNFRFVSPFDESLYDLRFSGSSIATGTGVGYPILWLSGAFLPFIFTVGLVEKKKLLILLCIIGQFILYMTQANKQFIFSILFMFLFYLLLKKVKNFGIVLASILSIFTILLICTQLYAKENIQLIFFPITSIFIMRTLAVSSVNVIYYYDFFRDHQFTYFSHINIIGKLITNPYGNKEVGQVIGFYFSAGDENYCANANFYITDGIAGLGISGLIVMGLISCIVFYLIDSLSQKHNILFAGTLVSYAGANLMNVSIFTSLLSGGLLFITIFLFYYQNGLKRNI